MMLVPTVQADGWHVAAKVVPERMAAANTAAMRAWGEGIKAELREDVISVGLGPKVANTWRVDTYPDKAGIASLNPATNVYVKSGSATDIIDFNSADRVVGPRFGEALAIPQKAVPYKRGRGGKRKMSPAEVENFYNADLEPRKLKSGRIGLFINVSLSRSRRRQGQATKGPRAAPAKLTLMFVLVRDVPGRKLLDHPGIFRRWVDRYPAMVAAAASSGGL